MRLRNARMIGELIRDRRRMLGWSQSRLGEAAGLSRQWVHEMERGKDTAEVGAVLRALHALGLMVHVAGFTSPRATDGEAAAGESRPPERPLFSRRG